MIINKAIVLRIKPNGAQQAKLANHFGANRWLWNYFLNKRKMEYADNKLSSTYFKDAATLTKLKRTQEFSWLYNASTNSQQRTLKNLDDAYKRFFKGQSKFPKFKSKKSDQSYTLSGDITIKGKRLIIPKFKEGFKFNRDLPNFCKINSVTIRQSATGLFYAILSTEAEAGHAPKTRQSVGVDMGLTDFIVISDGNKVKNPRILKRKAKKLKQAQQHLARKKKGSNRYNAQKVKVAQIHAKIANTRKDFHHKTSSMLINKFDTIGIENLAVKNMVKNRCLSKAISDAGWSEFISMLKYKARWYRKEVLEVGRFYPSSKTCGQCGFIAQSLPLNIRSWDCPLCGCVLDRDINAASNILNEALKSGRQSPITDIEKVSDCLAATFVEVSSS